MYPCDPPPTLFLALRREMLIIAAEREFHGSTQAIPIMEAWPGVYRPMPVRVDPDAEEKRRLAHNLANQRWAERHRVPKARPSRAGISPKNARSTGEIPIGSVVVSGRHRGTVTHFLPPGADPADCMPPGTKTNHQGGHHKHVPSVVARYCVVVATNGKQMYHFPKAATVEDEWRKG